MSGVITQSFPSLNAPMTDKNGILTLAWRPFMTALWNRTGGAPGQDGTFAMLNGNPNITFQVSPAITSVQAPPLAQVQSLDTATLTSAKTFATSAANTAQANAEAYALQQIQQGSGAAPAAITVTASPFTYTATAVGHVLMSGTVTGLTLTRGTTTLTLPLTAPIVPLDNGDILKVTYSSAPTMTWIPR